MRIGAVVLAVLLLPGCLWSARTETPSATALTPAQGHWDVLSRTPRVFDGIALAALSDGIAMWYVTGAQDADPLGLYVWKPGIPFTLMLPREPYDTTFAIAGHGADVLLFRRDGGGMRVDRFDTITRKLTTEPRDPQDEVVSHDFLAPGSQPRIFQGTSTVSNADTIYLAGGCCERGALWRYEVPSHRVDKISELPSSAPHEQSPPLIQVADGLLFGAVWMTSDPSIWRFGNGDWTRLESWPYGSLEIAKIGDEVWKFSYYCAYHGDSALWIAPPVAEVGAHARVHEVIQFHGQTYFLIEHPRADGRGFFARWDPVQDRGIVNPKCTIPAP